MLKIISSLISSNITIALLFYDSLALLAFLLITTERLLDRDYVS